MGAYRSSRQHIPGEEGSAAVEFALTASVFLMALIGLMKVCLAIYSFHFVSEAAREATRYAIVHGSSSSSPATSDSVSTYVKNLGYPGIVSSQLTVTTTCSTAVTGTYVTFPSTCNKAGNYVKVNIQYDFPLSIPFMATKTYTMTSTAVSVVSQ